jgi:Flp pilus assembly protein TadG
MSRRSQRGTAAVELALLAPLLLVVGLAVVGFGRIASSRAQVDGAAHAAARAASIAVTPAEAGPAAQREAAEVLGQHGVTCRQLGVDVNTAAFHPGGWVAVTVRCSADLGDLAVAGFPGSTTLSARFVSPIDTYRGGQ